MPLKKILSILIVLFISQFNSHIQAQGRKTRILFLLDCSGSMLAKLNKETRMDVAKRLLSNIVDSLREETQVELALRVYGSQKEPRFFDCQDTKLEVPFQAGNHDQMIDRIKAVQPKGFTLIAQSLLKSSEDFPKDPNARNVIILITDGLEECKGDPCAVSEALQKQGIILRPFVIGVDGNSDFAAAFQCVGKYYPAKTEEAFRQVLNVVISQALNNTTAQVNLLDQDGRALESNVGMNFYNMGTGKLEYSFVHTMNDRGTPDTLSLEPTIKYRLIVHTVPPIEKENIELIPGRHNVIAVDAPQGSLQIIVKGLPPGEKIPTIIRRNDEYHTVTVQDINTTRKLITGLYDLEILTLPRIHFKELSVNQYSITKVEIPTPGKLAIRSMHDVNASIYQWNRGRLEWVCDLDVGIRNKVLTLQPTLDKPYRVIYRYKHITRAIYTYEKDIFISPGMTTQLNL